MVLVLGTFAPLVAGSLRVDFGDNNGFTHALAMSGGHYPECNFVTEKMLMHLAAVDADLLAARVGSVANIADESTRDTFDLVSAFQATYVPTDTRFHDPLHCLFRLLADRYRVDLGAVRHIVRA